MIITIILQLHSTSDSLIFNVVRLSFRESFLIPLHIKMFVICRTLQLPLVICKLLSGTRDETSLMFQNQ